ncbi:unnamed protein product [Mytilus edulis]|uniref:LRAT domain-containing protein n=1 Tax=Mytilus edulis TaxID=6550 RepID=A0A8S3VCB1_MYTED|nr:unnamed protein product [Mytilus edulis]
MASFQRILPTSSTFQQHGDESSFFTNMLSRFQGKENELHRVLQIEKSNLSVDEKIRNDIDISQSELVSLTNEVLDSDDFVQQLEQNDISEIKNLGQRKNEVDDFLETLGTTCEECMTYEKVDLIPQIKPGDHIRFHNYKGGINVYNHHAIVTDVQAKENQRVGQMTLIHYQGDFTQKFTVLRDTKEYNTKTVEIDIVRYHRRPFKPEQIVERANKMADKFENNEHAESYNVFENNCEDKSNEIVTGSKHSNQVSSVANYLKCTISWLLKLFF